MRSVRIKKLYSKQPNLELTEEFGPTAFNVSSERHGQSGVNEIAQASKRRRWNRAWNRACIVACNYVCLSIICIIVICDMSCS